MSKRSKNVGNVKKVKHRSKSKPKQKTKVIRDHIHFYRKGQFLNNTGIQNELITQVKKQQTDAKQEIKRLEAADKPVPDFMRQVTTSSPSTIVHDILSGRRLKEVVLKELLEDQERKKQQKRLHHSNGSLISKT